MKKTSRIVTHTYDVKAAHAFNVYNTNQVFYVYLHIITKSGLQLCIGEGKIDNLALQVITSRQKGEAMKDGYQQTIAFYPHNASSKLSSIVIAESPVKCTYSPAVWNDDGQ